MGKIHKKILIIEDSDSLVNVITSCFEEFYKDSFVFVNKNPINSIGEAMKTIDKNHCDIILLDHQLTGNGSEGLEIAQKITGKIKKDGILVLSTSILVSTSSELISLYKKNGVLHFPGKNFLEIKECIDDKCECYAL